MKQHWNIQILKPIIQQSYSFTEVLIKLNLRAAGYNYRTLKKYIDKYELDTTHFIHVRKNLFQPTLLSDVFLNVKPMQSSKLKEKLYTVGLKQKICEICGQNENWYGKKIIHILDHINGNHLDNRLENLRILCPNCNSTTETFCGRKNKKNSSIKIEKYKKYDEQQKILIPIVLNSDIDFTKFGWVNELAHLLNKKPQKINIWMKKYMSDFYKSCFKRKCRYTVKPN